MPRSRPGAGSVRRGPFAVGDLRQSDGAKRGPYKRDRRPALSGIELRRKQLNVTIVDLCGRASLGERTYRRMQRTGLCFPRQLQALRMALRSIESELKRRHQLFPGEDR